MTNFYAGTVWDVHDGHEPRPRIRWQYLGIPRVRV